SDAQTMKELSRLEIQSNAATDLPPEAKEAAERVEAAERAAAEGRLATAKSLVVGDAEKGLEAAQAATRALPASTDAWRLVAWFSLRDAVSSGKDAEGRE